MEDQHIQNSRNPLACRCSAFHGQNCLCWEKASAAWLSPIAAFPLQPETTFRVMLSDSYSLRCGRDTRCSVTANAPVRRCVLGLGVSVCNRIAACRTRSERACSHRSVRPSVCCGPDLCACRKWLRFCKLWVCSRTGEQDCILVSTWGPNLIQSSVVTCYLNILCWIAFPWFWSIYYVSCNLSACFFLLAFLHLFKTSTTKTTKHGVEKSVLEVAGECM